MTLLERIMLDYKEAMKEKNESKKTVLNLILAKIKNKAIEIQKELEESEIFAIIKKEIKEIVETIGFLQKVNKNKEMEEEQQKKLLLEFYLPPTMTKEQTTDLIKKLMAEHNITDLQTQRGLLMKELMAKYKTDIDTQLVNEIISEMLVMLV